MTDMRAMKARAVEYGEVAGPLPRITRGAVKKSGPIRTSCPSTSASAPFCPLSRECTWQMLKGRIGLSEAGVF